MAAMKHLSPMNPCKLAVVVACLSSAFMAQAADPALDVKLTPLADRVRVEIGGQLFTEYIYGDGTTRPYCYPILAADGTPLTRNFPMKNVPGEDTDHPWHKSLFFAHSSVNGVDFWNEGHGDAGRSPSAKGNTVQDKVETSSGTVGVLRTHDNWMAPDGKLICTDDRSIRFHAKFEARKPFARFFHRWFHTRFPTSAETRIIDYEVTLHAQPDAPLVLGDNKDGSMAIRLAQWMTMPHKSQGGGASITGESNSVASVSVSVGHIVNSAGDHDGNTWGKRADWCDYFAEHNGNIYGVAIFDNPQNLRHPTWWQVRDYGLFGANPFGQHDFESLKDQPHIGDYTIPAGGSLTMKYRFYFHNGDEKAADIAEHYKEYAAEK